MGHVTFRKFLKKTNRLDWVLLTISLFGAIIALISLFRGILLDRQVQVEYIAGGNSVLGEANSTIFVDIEGSVISPGVYELSEGSRMKDVLVMAKGLSDDADRLFCDKNLNMAELLKDGQKVYIPSIQSTGAPTGYGEANSGGKKISINTATSAELDTLWGIGSARAEDIVKNRPYQSVDELVSKGVLTKNLVEKNIDKLSVY